MPIEINIRSDFKGISKFLTDAQRKCLPRIAAMALRRTMRKVRTQTSKEVRNRLNLPAKAVNDKLKVKRITPRRLVGELTASGDSIRLTRFKGTKQNRRGVSTKVLKSKRRTTIRHAFIGRGKGGVQLVFRRKRAASGQLVGQYPIVALFGPSVGSQVNDPMLTKKLLKVGTTQWPKEFQAAARFQFKVKKCGS